MGTADNTYGAREFGPADWQNARWRRRGGSRWSPFEIIAMVLGFIVFWPSDWRFSSTRVGSTATADPICRHWRQTSTRRPGR